MENGATSGTACQGQRPISHREALRDRAGTASAAGGAVADEDDLADPNLGQMRPGITADFGMRHGLQS